MARPHARARQGKPLPALSEDYGYLDRHTIVVNRVLGARSATRAARRPCIGTSHARSPPTPAARSKERHEAAGEGARRRRWRGGADLPARAVPRTPASQWIMIRTDIEEAMEAARKELK